MVPNRLKTFNETFNDFFNNEYVTGMWRVKSGSGRIVLKTLEPLYNRR